VPNRETAEVRREKIADFLTSHFSPLTIVLI